MTVVCMIRYYYLKSSKTYLNALTHGHVRNFSRHVRPFLDMSDLPYDNGHMILISLLVVFMPVAL